ncbi:MAG: alpha/beta hydrolase [Marinilabiliaceae bacterium]|jgi:pimeloyl-ACP methyl ester carboxylesterase|nr:alpha/beta hydrolase [Marinilabiliaceae bacterium]
MKEKYSEYSGGKIYYTVRGKGTTIVLIHGYLEASEVWGSFADRLAKYHRVIALDLPGNGKSSLYPQDHTMCFHSGAVKSVLDQEQADRVVMIGHSLGGYVTLSFVENYTERLDGYIMLHSHPYADTPEIIENRQREIRIVEAGKKDTIYPVNIPRMFADKNLEIFSEDVERLKIIASQHRAEGIISVLKGMIKRKSRADIMLNSRLPMLYVLGKMDNYIPYNDIMSRLLMPATGEIVSLENSGHMGFLEETDKLASIILKFVSNLKNQS